MIKYKAKREIEISGIAGPVITKKGSKDRIIEKNFKCNGL